MPTPGEHKTVQALGLAYAEAEGALLEQFPPPPKGYGGTGRESVEHLRNRGKFFDHEEKRDHFQDLFCTLHHELMTAKTHVHALNFQSQYHE